MFESSREVTSEEIESHVPLMQGQGLATDSGMIKNNCCNDFITIMGQ